MAYPPAITAQGPFAPLAVPPARRMLARTATPVSFDPQLGGFFDVIAAPFKLGAKVVSTGARTAYSAGRYAIQKAPTAIVGFAAGGPVGAAAAVGASIVTDIHGEPVEVGYGDNTIPPFSGTAQGYGTAATDQAAIRRFAAQPTQPKQLPPAGGFSAGSLLKYAPLLIAGAVLLKK